MKTAIIMRGIPGSGKSTEAEKIAKREGGVIHSTDNYHIKDGKYVFDKDKLNYYHGLNLEAFMESIDDGAPCVICDNTNVRRANYRDYIDYAKENGYNVTIITFKPMDIETHISRNIHSVPRETLEMMKKTLESNMYECEDDAYFIGIGFSESDLTKFKDK